MNRRAFLLGSTAAITAPLLPAIPAPAMATANTTTLYVDPSQFEFMPTKSVALYLQQYGRALRPPRLTFQTMEAAIDYATQNQPPEGSRCVIDLTPGEHPIWFAIEGRSNV